MNDKKGKPNKSNPLSLLLPDFCSRALHSYILRWDDFFSLCVSETKEYDGPVVLSPPSSSCFFFLSFFCCWSVYVGSLGVCSKGGAYLLQTATITAK